MDQFSKKKKNSETGFKKKILYSMLRRNRFSIKFTFPRAKMMKASCYGEMENFYSKIP